MVSLVKVIVLLRRLGTIFFCSRFSVRTVYCMFYFVLSKANLNQIYLNGIVLYDYSIYVSTRFTGKPLANYLELVYFYAHDITTINVLANVLPQVINTARSLKHLNLSACRFKIKHTIVIFKALKQVTGLKTIATYPPLPTSHPPPPCNSGPKLMHTSEKIV